MAFVKRGLGWGDAAVRIVVIEFFRAIIDGVRGEACVWASIMQQFIFNDSIHARVGLVSFG